MYRLKSITSIPLNNAKSTSYRRTHVEGVETKAATAREEKQQQTKQAKKSNSKKKKDDVINEQIK